MRHYVQHWIHDHWPDSNTIIAWGTIVLGAVGIYGVYLTRKSLHVTDRPYVLFEGMGMDPQIAPGAAPVFHIDLRNEGRTPAFIVEEQATFKIYSGSLPSKPEYATYPATKAENAAMPPNGKGRFNHFWPPDIVLTETLVNELKAGTKHLYIFGFVHYDDVFELHHATGWCAQYVPIDKPPFERLIFCGGGTYTYYR